MLAKRPPTKDDPSLPGLMNKLLPLLLVSCTGALCAADPIVIADFEGPDYGAWKTTGTAFGDGPAQGTLPKQMHVDGFLGHGLVNSFDGGDGATGTLTSPSFKIERKYLTFLIGGGGWPGETCMNLLLDGKVVRTATGPNTKPGGSEHLAPAAWDVAEFAGRQAVIQIVDQRKGGWGHINVDQIVLTDDRANIPLAAPPVPLQHDVATDLVAEKKFLYFPVKNGAPKRIVTVSVDGAVVRRFDIELANVEATRHTITETGPTSVTVEVELLGNETDWAAPLDVSAWKKKTLHIVVDALPEGSRTLTSLFQWDELPGGGDLYHETLRPQLQFSAKRGWNNDPNGLVFYRGEYHLFFQHNPYGWSWGNMHWGHATSKDLVHWTEHGEALYPDDMGPMFSGSAVVDAKNTSGLGRDGQPPMVMFYTAAGKPTRQCMAWSLDGRTFTKYAQNPVLEQITPGNRDPKVLWHEPTHQWVMVLYVGLPAPDGGVDDKGKPKVEHTIHFFTSPNLKDWTLRSHTSGLYECPDLFELPIDGDSTRRKWILTAASSEYFVGTFDGEKFTPETPKLTGVRGPGFYAAQTYSDVPDGRRIQIGWGRAASPGISFNQLLTFPCELKLHQTTDGPRLTWTPVKEMAALRGPAHPFGPAELQPGAANPLAGVNGELLEIRLALQPAAGSHLELNVRGLPIRYDASKQELEAGGVRASVPLANGLLHLTVFTDRTMFTIFAGDGLVYVPLPHIAKATDRTVALSVAQGSAKLTHADIYELNSIWASQAAAK
jgi:sucrose-6-phosphate hydrolase SacC (GH32 family)